MYAVYQRDFRVSPVMNFEDAGAWQTKFTYVLTGLEVKPFEEGRKELTPEMKEARTMIWEHRKRQTKWRGKTS